MNDEDDVHRSRNRRDWRSQGSARRSRSGNEGLDGLIERLLGDVASWFEDDGRGRRTPGRRTGGREAHRNAQPDDFTDVGSGSVTERDRNDASGEGPRDETNAAPSMRGKGPKNYRRSDARLGELVNDALLDDHRLDATDIEVSVVDGEVTLAGHVASREDKHRAEDLAAHVSGVDDVDNRLRVRRTDTPSSPRPGGLPGDAQQDADDYGHPS